MRFWNGALVTPGAVEAHSGSNGQYAVPCVKVANELTTISSLIANHTTFVTCLVGAPNLLTVLPKP